MLLHFAFDEMGWVALLVEHVPTYVALLRFLRCVIAGKPRLELLRSTAHSRADHARGLRARRQRYNI